MAEERMKTLKQRFSKQEAAPKPKPKRNRDRHTMYLDNGLVKRLDQAFRTAVHDLFPAEIEKADYLEACLTFALEHQEEIKAKLAAESSIEGE